MKVDVFYWELVLHTQDILEICIKSCFVYRFVKPFLPENRNTKLTGIVYFTAMLVLYLIPQEVSGAVFDAVGAAAVFLFLCFIDKRNIEQKLFLVSTYYLLEWITWGVVVALWNSSYYLDTLIPAIGDSSRLGFEAYVIRQICWLIIESLILEAVIRLLHRTYVYKMENMTKKELVLMLAPTFSLISGRLLFRYFVNVYEWDLKQYVWENHPSYNLILFLYQAISFAALFTIIITYQNIKESRRTAMEEEVLSRQVEDMKKHITEVENLYHDIRCLKHDMANHVMVLERLYGENAAAGEYVAQLKQQMQAPALSEKIKSGNPVTDVILTEKQKEAEAKGIAFRSDFYYFENVSLNAFDVSVILSNALNNAIEAAEACDKPYIHVSSYRKNHAYMIEIRNSMTGVRTIDSGSGLPITTKTGGMHGFGLSNIRKVARKDYGDIDIRQDGQEFVLTVMLMADS